MNSIIQLENFDLESIVKSQYEETDSFPLMKSAVAVPIIAMVYVLFVLKIGPAFMKNRKPYQLKTTLIAYNTFQVIFSIHLFWRGMNYVMNHGLVNSKCYVHDPNTRNEVLINIWIYFVAKVTELLDTVFFVLRKKNNQVSFLHVYHHTLMMVGTWCFLKWAPADPLIFIGFFNAAVHIAMYGYYGLAALGPHMQPYLTWKKYLTTLQLIQFVVDFVVMVGIVKYSECPPSPRLSSFIVFNIFLFMYLFGNFYYRNYVKSKKSMCDINDDKCN